MYVSGIDYTILAADNGVTGTFARLESDYAYLIPILTYTLTTVTMELGRQNTPVFPETCPPETQPPGAQPPEPRRIDPFAVPRR